MLYEGKLETVWQVATSDKISADNPGGVATIDMLIPSSGGPGPHEHAQIEESFYVIDGEIEVKSEFGENIATKGAFVNISKGGIVHEFKNQTDKVAHLLCIVVPAGLETFFEEVGKPVSYGEFLPPPQMDPESAKQLQVIAEKHGQKVYPPDYWIRSGRPLSFPAR